jgi:beta-phosphoglucomutase
LGSASKTQDPSWRNWDHIISICDGNDVSNAKPDPEVFLIAAKLLGARTRRRHCFEDSVAGVQAANIGKMTSIGMGKNI